jgi:hypothetical protein
MEVRTTKWFLEKDERIEQSRKFGEIHSLQRNYLIKRAEALFAQGQIPSEDLEVLQVLVKYSESKQLSLAPFDQRYQDGERVIANLLERNLIRSYLVKKAQDMGIALATSVTESEQLVLDRPECFDDFEVSFIKKFRDPKVKKLTGWTQKQSASDLVTMMASTRR